MADAQEIIDAATLKLGRRPAGTTMSTHNSSLNTELFEAFQDLVSELNEGNKLQIPTPALVSTTLDLYPGQLRPLKLIFTEVAMSICRVREISPKLAQEIEEGKDKLNKYRNIDLSIDLGEYNRTGRYDIKSDR